MEKGPAAPEPWFLTVSDVERKSVITRSGLLLGGGVGVGVGGGVGEGVGVGVGVGVGSAGSGGGATISIVDMRRRNWPFSPFCMLRRPESRSPPVSSRVISGPGT